MTGLSGPSCVIVPISSHEKSSFVCRAAVMLQGGGLAGAAVAGLMYTVAVKYRFVSGDA